MRTIKFRAWDKENETMLLLLPTITRFDYENGWVLSFSVDGYKEFYCHEGYDIKPELEIMEFTGLKDRNGKDIYEGDVVKFSGHYSGDSWIKEHTEIIEWDINGYTDSLMVGYADEADWCEIVGNIYENPELLEKA